MSSHEPSSGEKPVAAGDGEPAIYASYFKLPLREKRFLRLYVPAMLWVLAAVAFVWARAQQSPGDAVWDDAKVRTFTGWYLAKPYPMLFADDCGTGKPGVMMLVEVGKHGVERMPAGSNGQRMRIDGWLLRREGRTMIELDPDAEPKPQVDEAAGGARAMPAALSATGEPVARVLRGEIVDFKCFLGAMKPGSGKAHKACAALCVGGGVPPVLVCRDGAGGADFYILQSPGGVPMDESLRRFIGDEIEISGQETTLGDVKILTVVAGSARRR
jgi:hypothetical protein